MKEERLILSIKEMKRIKVMELLCNGSIDNQQAAERLGICERQVLRLKKKYRNQGDKGVIHGNKGKISAKRIDDITRETIVKLFSEKYFGFNFSHFTEKLNELEGIKISRSSVSRILKSKGITSKRAVKHRRKLHRSRPRKKAAGMLWQTDATTFEWFGTGNGYATLHAYIDDATSEIVGAFFTENECTIGYVEALKQGIENYGMPFDIYSDRHTIFRSPVDKNRTNFGLGLEELGIGQIFALSPQAKGRIERLWGSFQDRLPGEFRLRGITSIEKANLILPEILDEYNAKYAVQAEEENVYVKVDSAINFNLLFSNRETRKTDSGGNISYKGHKYSPLLNCRKLSSRKVEVREMLNGQVYVNFDGKFIEMQKMEKPVKKISVKESRPVSSYKPASNHPWRHSPVGTKEQKYINTGRRRDIFIDHSR